MGGVLSLVSEKCKKLSSALKGSSEESNNLDDPTCSTRMTDLTYIPPKKYQTQKTILTSENFKDFLSSTTNCVSRPSNESENIFNNFNLKKKFNPQSRNIQNLNYNTNSNNTTNITHLINNPSYNTFPYPDYKFRYKKSFSNQKNGKIEKIENLLKNEKFTKKSKFLQISNFFRRFHNSKTTRPWNLRQSPLSPLQKRLQTLRNESIEKISLIQN
jgi:hypothetical protein